MCPYGWTFVFYGFVTKMGEKEKAFLIEDCAETCGATYKNKKIGGLI